MPTDAPARARVLASLPPPEQYLTVDALEELVSEEAHGVELLDGTLLVSPTPRLRHQRVVGDIFAHLHAWCRTTSGLALVAPTGMHLASDTLLVPDVIVLDSDQVGRLTDAQYVTFPPRLVVEVSSPSTRSRDVGLKRDAYARFGIAEYWFIDLEHKQILVHVHDGRGYPAPHTLGLGDMLRATTLPGVEVAVADILATP